MISILRSLAIYSTFIAIAGCTVVPGGHVDVGLLIEEEPYDIYPRINVRPINPTLLSELQMSEPGAKTNKALDKEIGQYSYLIGKGDILNITVWDHPELTTPAGQFRSPGESGNVVHSDGQIFYPYVGKISVINKTVDEVRQLITDQLSQYIESPQIDVSVAAYRSQRAFVTGAVETPSVIPVTNLPLTLLDALNLSGGMSPDADWRSVVLTTETSEGLKDELIDLYALYEKGDISQNRLIKHNDIVHIPRNDKLKVFVMGDVKTPSTQRMDRSYMTLAEALNNAGGINEETANPSGVFVLRASETEGMVADVFQLDASQSAMLILSTQFKLQPLDIVYVTSAPVARWNRVISQLVPTFSIVRLASEANRQSSN